METMPAVLETTAPCSPRRAARRTSLQAAKSSLLRGERYRQAEARLAQSLRQCSNEPSVHELQLRTLEQTTRMLAQFAEESCHQAKELASMTASRSKIANLDPASYQSLLSQRWRAKHQQDLISQNMKILQGTIIALARMPSGAGGSLSLGGHEDQGPSPEDRTYTNLVAFLCCPQRVAPLHHHRSRSPLLNIYLRPFYLDPSTSVLTPPPTPNTPTPLPESPTKSTTATETSSDMSLDMHLQTPVVTDSLVEQQARLTINNDEAGTATILTQPLPNPALPDPSNVKVELPDYVHKLLANFEAQESHDLTPSGTIIKFLEEGTPSTETRRGGFWPFKGRGRSKERGASVASQPVLRPKSSFRKLSEFISASDMLTSRKKVNISSRGGEMKTTTLTSASVAAGSRRRDESVSSTASTYSPTSTDQVNGGALASRLASYLSFTSTNVTSV